MRADFNWHQFETSLKLTYPYLDGTYLSATKSAIDPSRPCDAIDILANDLKQWTMNFIEGAARPCSKTSCYSPPTGALRGQEINKKWHKRTLQFVRQTNQKIEKLAAKFKDAQKCEYCIRVTSSEDQNLCTHHTAGPSSWSGGAINLIINGEKRDTLSTGFTDFEYCAAWDQIDVLNDKIQLQSTNSDGVCITSVSLNGNEMLVGKLNDQPSQGFIGLPEAFQGL